MAEYNLFYDSDDNWYDKETPDSDEDSDDYYDCPPSDDESDEDEKDWRDNYYDEVHDDEVLGNDTHNKHSSSYEPEPSAEEIIKEAMREKNVHHNDIPKETEPFSSRKAKNSKRYFEMKGFAWFSCPMKHNRWPSAHARCCLDLRERKICCRDKQDCRRGRCETPTNPEFTREALERMVSYAVRQYLRNTGQEIRNPSPRDSDDDDARRNGPHDMKRCGMCQSLGREC